MNFPNEFDNKPSEKNPLTDKNATSGNPEKTGGNSAKNNDNIAKAAQPDRSSLAAIKEMSKPFTAGLVNALEVMIMPAAGQADDDKAKLLVGDKPVIVDGKRYTWDNKEDANLNLVKLAQRDNLTDEQRLAVNLAIHGNLKESIRRLCGQKPDESFLEKPWDGNPRITELKFKEQNRNNSATVNSEDAFLVKGTDATAYVKRYFEAREYIKAVQAQPGVPKLDTLEYPLLEVQLEKLNKSIVAKQNIGNYRTPDARKQAAKSNAASGDPFDALENAPASFDSPTKVAGQGAQNNAPKDANKTEEPLTVITAKAETASGSTKDDSTKGSNWGLWALGGSVYLAGNLIHRNFMEPWRGLQGEIELRKVFERGARWLTRPDRVASSGLRWLAGRDLDWVTSNNMLTDNRAFRAWSRSQRLDLLANARDRGPQAEVSVLLEKVLQDGEIKKWPAETDKAAWKGLYDGLRTEYYQNNWRRWLTKGANTQFDGLLKDVYDRMESRSRSSQSPEEFCKNYTENGIKQFVKTVIDQAPKIKSEISKAEGANAVNNYEEYNNNLESRINNRKTRSVERNACELLLRESQKAETNVNFETFLSTNYDFKETENFDGFLQWASREGNQGAQVDLLTKLETDAYASLRTKAAHEAAKEDGKDISEFFAVSETRRRVAMDVEEDPLKKIENKELQELAREVSEAKTPAAREALAKKASEWVYNTAIKDAAKAGLDFESKQVNRSSGKGGDGLPNTTLTQKGTFQQIFVNTYQSLNEALAKNPKAQSEAMSEIATTFNRQSAVLETHLVNGELSLRDCLKKVGQRVPVEKGHLDMIRRLANARTVEEIPVKAERALFRRAALLTQKKFEGVNIINTSRLDADTADSVKETFEGYLISEREKITAALDYAPSGMKTSYSDALAKGMSNAIDDYAEYVETADSFNLGQFISDRQRVLKFAPINELGRMNSGDIDHDPIEAEGPAEGPAERPADAPRAPEPPPPPDALSDIRRADPEMAKALEGKSAAEIPKAVQHEVFKRACNEARDAGIPLNTTIPGAGNAKAFQGILSKHASRAKASFVKGKTLDNAAKQSVLDICDSTPLGSDVAFASGKTPQTYMAGLGYNHEPATPDPPAGIPAEEPIEDKARTAEIPPPPDALSDIRRADPEMAKALEGKSPAEIPKAVQHEVFKRACNEARDAGIPLNTTVPGAGNTKAFQGILSKHASRAKASFVKEKTLDTATKQSVLDICDSTPLGSDAAFVSGKTPKVYMSALGYNYSESPSPSPAPDIGSEAPVAAEGPVVETQPVPETEKESDLLTDLNKERTLESVKRGIARQYFELGADYGIPMHNQELGREALLQELQEREKTCADTIEKKALGSLINEVNRTETENLTPAQLLAEIAEPNGTAQKDFILEAWTEKLDALGEFRAKPTVEARDTCVEVLREHLTAHAADFNADQIKELNALINRLSSQPPNEPFNSQLLAEWNRLPQATNHDYDWERESVKAPGEVVAEFMYRAEKAGISNAIPADAQLKVDEIIADMRNAYGAEEANDALTEKLNSLDALETNLRSPEAQASPLDQSVNEFAKAAEAFPERTLTLRRAGNEPSGELIYDHADGPRIRNADGGIMSREETDRMIEKRLNLVIDHLPKDDPRRAEAIRLRDSIGKPAQGAKDPRSGEGKRSRFLAAAMLTELAASALFAVLFKKQQTNTFIRPGDKAKPGS